MLKQFIEKIGGNYPLKEIDAGEYGKANVAGMDFVMKGYEAQGLGFVSVMTAASKMGMSMDTMIINPFEMDAPLLSYDRISVMGNDILLMELYDTRLNKEKTMAEDGMLFNEVLKRYADLTDGTTAPAWYDDIRYPQSFEKKETASESEHLDQMSVDYLDAYLKKLKDSPSCDPERKKNAASIYTEGLLNNGGASTDNFLKEKGKEYTQNLFRNVLFGTGEPR